MSEQIPTFGGAGGIPSLGDLGGTSVPTLHLAPATRPLTAQQQLQPASLKVTNYITAHQIIDRVKQRKMSWQEAYTVLKDLPLSVKDQLMSEIKPKNFNDAVEPGTLDAIRAVGGETATKHGGSVLGNLVEDVASTVKGLPAGFVKMGVATAKDFARAGGSPVAVLQNIAQNNSDIRSDIIDPTVDQYAHTYGPAVHGNFGETAHRIGEHPLGPILDALAVASAGVGTVGRVAAASEAINATRVTVESADKLRMGVTASKPAGQFIIAKGKGSSTLWTVRSPNGRVVASNFPSKEAAVAHGQSLATGGILAPVLETEWRDFANPKFAAAQDELAGLQSEMKDVGDKIYKTWYPYADAQYAARNAPQAAGEYTRDFGAAHGFERDLTNLSNQKISLQDRIRKLEASISGTAFKPGDRLSPTVKQNVVTNPSKPRSSLSIGLDAATQRPRGSLIDAYERARGISHQAEIESIIQETVNNVFADPNLRLDRKSTSEVAQQIAGDIAQTFQRDKSGISKLSDESPSFISPAGAAALKSVGITVREVSDLVRAGAVFLRPAYIPNNWAGNAFLNMVQSGVFAPVNLGKALTTDKHIGTKYTRAVDQFMGFNAAELVTAGRGQGYVSSVMDPVAHTMGQIADQPFRRAAFYHELRRMGYKKMEDVQRLMDKAQTESGKFGGEDGIEVTDRAAQTPALQELGTAARAAQEEIIKFGKMNAMERNVGRNLIFVYSWMRGAGRYFGRFPFQHAIQSAAFSSIGNIGQKWLTDEMGGVPFYLIGAIPVGHDDKGNPILINPFSVNPLGTGAELLSAGASVGAILKDPSSFDKYSQEDPAQLLNPVIRSGLEAYTGGRPIAESLKESISVERLKRNLEHPGRGQVYPTTRREAAGQFFFGSLFPRQANQQAITRSLERETSDQPLQRLDTEKAEIEKRTGQKVPAEFIKAYKADVTELEKQKDFQHSYAADHGSQGFQNLPPQNRAEAAVDYLRRYSLITSDQLSQIESELSKATTDEQYNAIANYLWNATGAGKIRDKWMEMLHSTRNAQELTRYRP